MTSLVATRRYFGVPLEVPYWSNVPMYRISNGTRREALLHEDEVSCKHSKASLENAP